MAYVGVWEEGGNQRVGEKTWVNKAVADWQGHCVGQSQEYPQRNLANCFRFPLLVFNNCLADQAHAINPILKMAG